MHTLRHTVLRCGLVTVVTFSSALVIAAPAPYSRVSIDNFGQVNTEYYRGAQPKGHDYADLAAMGVKAVVDLQQDGQKNEQQLVTAAGMKYYRIPMTTRVAPTSTQLEGFLNFVNDPANQPVYVHCAGGRHRTGVMTAVYRMAHDHWSSDQAFKEMKQYRFGADVLHPEFKKFVYQYKGEDRVSSGVLATAVLSPGP